MRKQELRKPLNVELSKGANHRGNLKRLKQGLKKLVESECSNRNNQENGEGTTQHACRKEYWGPARQVQWLNKNITEAT